MMPENITWDRITSPPFDNPAHVLHICHCLHDLKLGDHIEIQWRINNDISYGEPIRFLKLLVDNKRYGVVGHIVSCDQQLKVHCVYVSSLIVDICIYLRQISEGGMYEGADTRADIIKLVLIVADIIEIERVFDLTSYCEGSISISMCLHQTSFCFICSHLTSGQKEGDELRRNSDVLEILRKTRFPRVHGVGDEYSPQTILEHDRVIWLGDLNYRIALSYRSAKALVEMRNWRALLEKDQLQIEQRRGRVFNGWNEGKIYFPPTYKYSNNSDRYAGDDRHLKEKRRTLAWRTSLEDLMSIDHGTDPGSYTIDRFSKQLERQSSQMETMNLPESINILVSEKQYCWELVLFDTTNQAGQMQTQASTDNMNGFPKTIMDYLFDQPLTTNYQPPTTTFQHQYNPFLDDMSDFSMNTMPFSDKNALALATTPPNNQQALALIPTTPPSDQQALALTYHDDNLLLAAPTFQAIKPTFCETITLLNDQQALPLTIPDDNLFLAAPTFQATKPTFSDIAMPQK
ncbi:hypothetical protein ACFE04_014049 [Oxalis oulophora]